MLLLLLVPKSLCQVDVEVRADKATYLVGEPIFVILTVTNIGTEAIGYSYCDGQVDLAVVGAEKKQVRNLWGCGVGIGGASACGIDHPPLMAPHASVSFYYLLTGYRLGAGNHVLQAKGKAGVRWKYYPDMRANAPPSPPPQHKEGDPVAGVAFDISLPIALAPGSQEELERAYAPYIADAGRPGAGTAEMLRAREAIAEMAPEFLEKTIAGFASGPTPTPNLAVKELGQIDSAESRADLIRLYDASTDLNLRKQIVEALANLATPDQVEFFAGLLPGRSTDIDDQIREWAALGLGQIGGDAAVRALAAGIATSSGRVRQTAVAALGNTKSRSAVPLLIRLYGDGDNLVRNDVCGALVELTHREWCDGSGISVALQQAQWLRWWKANAPRTALYGHDECPKSNAQLPPLN